MGALGLAGRRLQENGENLKQIVDGRIEIGPFDLEDVFRK